jgi:uncharacterized protein (TIGR03437 family)
MMAGNFPYTLLAFLIASSAFAQPAIKSTEVVNSASYLQQGLPGAGIAQGSIFTIFGSGLGPDTLVQAGPLPLETSLGGTSVAVTIGGQIINAFILAAVGSQVNALLPSATPIGSGTVTVTYNNQVSASEPVQIVSASFAPYTYNSRGAGQAVATDLSYRQNTIIHTYHPGDWVVLWGTGLGAINGDDSTTPPVGGIGSPTVYVGNAAVTPYYAGRSAAFPGLDQVTFQVPSGVEGCYVPVAVEANGVVGGGSASIAVSASGQTCSDSILGSGLIGRLAAGGTVDFGFVQLYDVDIFGSSYPGTVVPDYASATFSEFTPQTAGLASYGVSPGYCIANTSNPDASPAQLDAGAAIMMRGQFNGMTTTVSVPQINRGNYFTPTYLGDSFSQEFFTLTASGAGGADIGPFSVTQNNAPQFAILNGFSAYQTIPLSNDLTITLGGAFSPQLIIGGVSWPTPSQNLGGSFLCSVPASASSFTIPKWVLSTLPPSGTSYSGSTDYALGYIWIGLPASALTFQANGLDSGILVETYSSGYPVYFK